MAKKKTQGGNSPAKQKDLTGYIQKGIGMYLKPYKMGYNYLKDNVTKIKGYMNSDDEMKPMKPKEAKPIKQPKKPNDAIVFDMQQQLKQEQKNKLKELPTLKNSNPTRQDFHPLKNNRDTNMIKQVNRMNNDNYDLIEGDKNQNMNVDGDVNQQKGFGGG